MQMTLAFITWSAGYKAQVVWPDGHESYLSLSVDWDRAQFGESTAAIQITDAIAVAVGCDPSLVLVHGGPK